MEQFDKDENLSPSPTIFSGQSQVINSRRKLQKCFGQFLRQIGEIFEETEDIDQEFYKEVQSCISSFQIMSLRPNNEVMRTEEIQNHTKVDEMPPETETII